MSGDYKVIKVYLETISYNIMIFQVPENEINDKLTYFTREKGLIAKSLYEDFLIATFVSNVDQFLQHLRQKDVTEEQVKNARIELIDKIIGINPALTPGNLVINNNNVLKIREEDKKDDEILLTENDFWERDIYSGANDPSIEDQSNELDKSVIKNVKDLNFLTVQKFWRRLGQYVTIKQFEPGSELIILSNRSFAARTAFEQYVVTICVEEIEDLFMRLDKMGLPTRVSPHILIHELYELCRKSNPFLDFDIYKDTMDDDESSIDPFDGVKTAGQNDPTSSFSDASKSKKRTKLFRHLEKPVLLGLGEKIKKQVIGQDKPIDDLVDAIQRASVGLKDPDQPIGSFIFTGFTGIGKTYTAKILAEELTGSRQNLVTIDCSEYSADHEYAKLIGAPSGYIGHDQGGYLTNAVRKNPFSVVLFDEIEKASEKVHQLMLQIMEEARLTDGRGQLVSFKDAVIIMTSNLGVKQIEDVCKTIGFGSVSKLTKEKRIAAVREALKKKFKPEFLNRVTCMIDFDKLSKKDYMKIIKLELERLKKNLKLNRTAYSKLNVKFDKSLVGHIYKVGIDDAFGARPLKRAIEREISTPLAKKLLQEDIDCETTKVEVSSKKDKVTIGFTCVDLVDDPPFYMKAGT